jgi:hypothetical protein
MRLRDSLEPHSRGGGPALSGKTASRKTKDTSQDARDYGGRTCDDAEDVDHALGASLRGAASGRTDGGARGKGQVVTVEWDERMETMQKAKAEAEARAGASLSLSIYFAVCRLH